MIQAMYLSSVVIVLVERHERPQFLITPRRPANDGLEDAQDLLLRRTGPNLKEAPEGTLLRRGGHRRKRDREDVDLGQEPGAGPRVVKRPITPITLYDAPQLVVGTNPGDRQSWRLVPDELVGKADFADFEHLANLL